MLEGLLNMPEAAPGIALCAYGSSSSQQHIREVYDEVAWVLQDAGLATLLVNLLTADEETLNSQTGFFDINVSIFS